MTKRYNNPPPPENYTKPKPPPCPPAPPSREYTCNIFGFAESKESIKATEGYMREKDSGTQHNEVEHNTEEVETTDSACYSSWRRSEAYQCPMTKEGMIRAEERYKQFKVGWDSAISKAMLELERKHSEIKKTHSFYNIAKDIISKLKTR